LKSSRFVLTVVVFSLLGPPLGALSMFLPAFILDLSHITSNDLQGTLLVTISPVTYFYGGLPAAGTGAIIAALTRANFLIAHSRVLRFVAGAVIGGILGAGWQLLMRDLADPLALLKAGAFAGGVLGIFLPRTQWLAAVPSNNRWSGP